MKIHLEKRTIVISFIAAFFMLLFSISFWFYRHVFDKNQFLTHVSTGILTEESRDSIATLIIEESFKNTPLVKNILLEQAQPVLAGALNGPRVQVVMKNLINQIHTSLFSERPRAVVIDLGNVKRFIENVVSIIETISGEERREVRIPEKVVLIREGSLPSIAGVGMFFLWFGPFALIISIGFYLWLLFRENKLSTLQTIGATLSVISLIVVLLLKWYQPIFLARFQNTSVLTIADAVLHEFVTPLINQIMVLFGTGLILLIGALLTQYFLQRRSVRAKN